MPMAMNSKVIVQRDVLVKNNNLEDNLNAVADIMKKANTELQKASEGWMLKESDFEKNKNQFFSVKLHHFPSVL